MYDPVDERGVPRSRGIPRAVIIATIIGILAIFWVGEYTIQWAGYSHVWPSIKSVRVPLNGNYNP
ncbi:MAG TPA: hypothetical protein VFA29_07755 [Candidatus Baltobacteraceae bacterium]|nr:hypothetical protein [Candidatus Baltobacteraceae bacterium]